MCYNSDCRIEIKSRIDGEEATVSANGRVRKTPSEIQFDYELGGDACTLTVKDNEVVQIRRGEQDIKMAFRKSEQAECFFESGGYSGDFPVYTHGLEYKFNQKCDTVQKFTLLIVYTLGEQKIELDFSAEYKL